MRHLCHVIFLLYWFLYSWIALHVLARARSSVVIITTFDLLLILLLFTLADTMCTSSTVTCGLQDFVTYIGKSLTDTEKLAAAESRFTPHRLYEFPIRVGYEKRRSFNPTWLDEYKWLTYSPSKDGVYCTVCTLFSKRTKVCQLLTLALTFWTTATE